MPETGRSDTARSLVRRERLRFGAILFVISLFVFVALASYMRSLERDAIAGAGVDEQFTAAGQLRRAAEVTRAVKSLKLVTVEVSTRVTATSGDSSWRGDASATVHAPVRLFYGTDLSSLRVDSVSLSPLLNSCVVRVPGPERVATEVYSEDEDNTVHVGWLRFRTRAGEFHLGQARKDLHQQAREMALPARDAERVREETRSQVGSLVRRMLGPGTDVSVIFDDEPSPIVAPLAGRSAGAP
jgi:hypothetical protein